MNTRTIVSPASDAGRRARGRLGDRWLLVLVAVACCCAFGCARELPLATPPLVPCGGAPEALALGIEPPSPPRPYQLDVECADDPEAVWQCVETTEELVSLIAAAEPGRHDIVLENRTYHAPPDEDFQGLRLQGHRLWARGQGAAVLTFGIDAGGNNEAWAGGELHGLVIDLDDDEHALRVVGQDGAEDITAAVATWGVGGSNVVIADCVLRGPGADSPAGVHRGIWAAQTAGFRAERLIVDGFLRFGIIFDDGPGPPLFTHALLSDLHVRNVGDSAWRATACDPETPPELQACGTQEHGLWIGDPVLARRVRVREVAHTGIATAGTTDGALLEHLDIDGTGSGGAAGIYIERTTRDTAFRRLCIGPDTRWGVKSEWDHNGGELVPPLGPRGLFNSIADGLIESSYVGVNFDQGTVASSVERVTIRGFERAGIAMFHNVATPLDYDEPLPTAADYLANQGGSQQDNLFQDTAGDPAADVEDVRCRFTRGHVVTATLSCEPP